MPDFQKLPELKTLPVKLPEKKSLKGIHLLLAEDDYFNIFIAQQFFKNWNITFDIAKTGGQVLQKLETKSYDLVLMDLQMPDMDGYEATEIIRNSLAAYRNVPIIALTASAILEIKDRAFAVGMNDYISKPFNPEILFKKIQKYSLHNVEVESL